MTDVALIPLRNKAGETVAFAKVDAADAAVVNERRWHLTSDGYAQSAVKIDGRYVTQRMHRFLLGLGRGDDRVADHVNGERLDNRRCNLRAVTVLANNQRRGPRVIGTSRFRGVSRVMNTAGKQWHASVRFRDRLFHLGNWDTEEEAAEIAAAVRAALMPFSADADEAAA